MTVLSLTAAFSVGYRKKAGMNYVARAQHRAQVKRETQYTFQEAGTAFFQGQILEEALEKKNNRKLLQIYRGATDFLSSTTNCVFDSLSDTTTHQQVGMLSKQSEQYTT